MLNHVKYLTLIRAVALLHQHQRARRTATGADAADGRQVAYIEVTVDDIAVANRLAHEVLGRSLDELPPQTRRLLDLLDGIVAARAAEVAIDRELVRFTRREIREATGWGDTQLKIHLGRLVDLELVVAHRSDKGNGFVYELVWDGAGRDGGRFLIGLTDPATLSASRVYDDGRSGPEAGRSGPGRPSVGGWSGPPRERKPLGTPGIPGLDIDDDADSTVPADDADRVVVTDMSRRAG